MYVNVGILTFLIGEFRINLLDVDSGIMSDIKASYHWLCSRITVIYHYLGLPQKKKSSFTGFLFPTEQIEPQREKKKKN